MVDILAALLYDPLIHTTAVSRRKGEGVYAAPKYEPTVSRRGLAPKNVLVSQPASSKLERTLPRCEKVSGGAPVEQLAPPKRERSADSIEQSPKRQCSVQSPRAITGQRAADSESDSRSRKRRSRARELGLVDLFCGIGGFSAGIQRLRRGQVRVVLAIDWSRCALRVYENQHGAEVTHCYTLGGDVVATASFLRDLLRRHGLADTYYHLHCSPPCKRVSQ